MNNNSFGGNVASKKRMLPSEIAHKFSSKDDFLNFFSKQVSTAPHVNPIFSANCILLQSLCATRISSARSSLVRRS